MKLEVPFFRSETDADCGPLALKMVLAFFGRDVSFEEIARRERRLDSGMVWSLGIAVAARERGYKVEFYSSENFSLDDGIDFYEKYADDRARLVLEGLKREAGRLGILKGDLSFDVLLEKVTAGSVPIVLINWFVLAGKDGFSGHFVPVTGYDEEFVYIHNPGLASPMAHMPVRRELFKRAWESKGTDKDCIIAFRSASR